MGMPSITVTFRESAEKSIVAVGEMVVALILKNTEAEGQTGMIKVSTPEDIPEWLNETHVEYIKQAFIGNGNTPRKVIAYIMANDEANYDNAKSILGVENWDYLTVPMATEEEVQGFADWIKTLRDSGKRVKAVLPNCAANSEGVINFATGSLNDGTRGYTAAEYCPRIAGLLAGTPLKESASYATLLELTDCAHLTNAEMDDAVAAGKFILFYDGEKIKTGRAVNSLISGGVMSKIKIVDAMDVMSTEIRRLIQDNFIGKYANTYDNKVVLISAITEYLDRLAAAGVIDYGHNVEIDMKAQAAYLRNNGVDTGSLTEKEIREYYTGTHVFLIISVVFYDVMEDFEITIEV